MAAAATTEQAPCAGHKAKAMAFPVIGSGLVPDPLEIQMQSERENLPALTVLGSPLRLSTTGTSALAGFRIIDILALIA
ncbi:MAG: hypothetical protein AAF667_06695 [Pseudomonadota bacterium]